MIVVDATPYRIDRYTVQRRPHIDPKDLVEVLAVYSAELGGLPVLSWERPAGSCAVWEHPLCQRVNDWQHHTFHWPEMAAAVAAAVEGEVLHQGVVYGGRS